jgi:hypothetical protein
MNFETWLRSHSHKKPTERWLRELYPWPVLAQADCEEGLKDRPQRISYDGIDYDVTLKSVQWQPKHGTYKFRLRVESDGLGWHARGFADDFDLCGTPDGSFVTLFHAKKEEPLEKFARAFFNRQWDKLISDAFRSVAVSRFLAASIVSQVVERAFSDVGLIHYPKARITCDTNPMFANEPYFWVGYRFFSEHAYSWARRSAGRASRIIALYFADTKYQFRTDLPWRGGTLHC